MAHPIRCKACEDYLFCANCGKRAEAEDHIPGAVGTGGKKIPFDPDRRRAWSTERGRILLLMRDHHPHTFLLAREVAEKLGSRSPNQVCTRIGELCAQALVTRTGRRRVTSTGAPADEWKLTDDGLSLFRHASTD